MSVTIARLFAASILTLLVAVSGFDRPAAAEPVGEADRAAIQSVITGQMDAFKQDDWTKAFGYAAPSIRLRFGSVERFASMVVTATPPYGVHETFSSKTCVRRRQSMTEVLVVGPDGVPVIATYVMERQEDGSWRIAGVYLREIADKSV